MNGLARRAICVAGRFALLAALLSAPTVAQQGSRAMTVDDFLSIRIVGDPQLSPDGSLIAFTVTTPSLSDDRNVSRLWLHNLANGTTRELTRGAGSDQSPRWARDGRTLAFLSTRTGTPQVWRIRTDGGEPVQLTSIPNGVNQYWWSPDTTSLFVAADVSWPDTTELQRREAEFPTSARMWTGLMYRHWNGWRAGLRQHLFRIDLPTGLANDITPFDHDVPTLALGGQDVAISPLGTELAIVFNADSVVATSTNNDIYLIGPDGTGLVPMTRNPGNDHSPVYAPNARWIAYLSMRTPGFEADRQELMVYDRASGDHRSLTGDWDASVLALSWAPDSRSLVVEVELRGERQLHRVDLATGRRALLVSGGSNSAPQLAPAGDTLIYLHQSAAAPPEIYLLPLVGRGPQTARKVTSLNATLLADLELPPVESFGFIGANRDSVFGLLIKPPGFDPARKYPVAYLIHGGPQSAWTDTWHLRWNYALFAARGYLVAGVNFHGSTGYGQAFTNSITRRWGDLPYQDLMRGVEYLERLPYVDSTRIGAAGASYGGYMIYWMAGRTTRFKTLVAHSGIFNTESMAGTTEELWFPTWEFGGSPVSPEARTLLAQWSPANFVAQWQTPMLISHGQQDFRVDVSEGLQAFTALQLRGVTSKFLYFPDEGHFVQKPRNRRLWWNVVLDWLDQYLTPASGDP